MLRTLLTVILAATTIPYSLAQDCKKGAPLAVVVTDTTGGVIPDASLNLDETLHATSGSDGRSRFACVAAGAHKLTVEREGFASLGITLKTPRAGVTTLQLVPATVETSVTVSDDDAAPQTVTSASAATQTLSGNRLQSLADDPDDLQRELQQMAALAGGNPKNTTISVDGFQDGSALPPKNSIAYIKVNPDTFSAEYREPPFGGGRVEVYTKPGASAFHGALFMTNGSPWMNARDPFSTSRASIGKQRYGVELSGPVIGKKTDFAVTLEHRQIDNFAVVNALTLDNNGNTTTTIANVATPQNLWLASARFNWQLTPKNTFITSYNARVNDQQNVGVGGTALQEAGYESATYEHNLRFTDVTLFSPRLMHEARFGMRWVGEDDTPNSNTPSLSVAGAFTGGGSSIGHQTFRQLRMEINDDAILTTKKHTLKFGTQIFINRENNRLTQYFNGQWVFNGLDEYRAGTPTAFQQVTGDPSVRYTDVNNVFYIQDDWNIGHGLHVGLGLRYFMQKSPSLHDGATPRFALLWAPGAKPRFTLHIHSGMFTGRVGIDDQNEIRRLDGTTRVSSLIYNPQFDATNTAAAYRNATPIHSMRTVANGIGNLWWGGHDIGGTGDLGKGWSLTANLIYGRIWNYWRSRNINQPTDGSPVGPRPITPNTNIYQVQASGQGYVWAEFFSIAQQKWKRANFFMGAVNVLQIDNTNDDTFFTPQNAKSDAGEFARRTENAPWQLFGNGTVHLPSKIDLSTDFSAQEGAGYNITTGSDNNGDGVFNDRPQYALPGDPNTVHTKYGDLVASGGTGVFGRNRGRMPWTVYLDTNLQRSFQLSGNKKSEHQQTLTVNLRSSNVLNHMNSTSLEGTLGSSRFGQAYAADPGRRIEGGLRYSF